MDGMDWNDRFGPRGDEGRDEPRERPRHPMVALLVILVLTCAGILAADRAGPFLANVGGLTAAAE